MAPFYGWGPLSNLIMIYLDMLIIGMSVEETLVYGDTVILLMQELVFMIYQEKSAMISTQTIKFLVMKIESKAVTI